MPSRSRAVAKLIGRGDKISAAYVSGEETFNTITSSAGSATLDLSSGTVFSHTLTEDVTYSFTNPPVSGTAYGFTLKITQDSTARTITWPASVDWAAATAPTLSAGSGEIDIFVLFTIDSGTTYYGFTSGQTMG